MIFRIRQISETADGRDIVRETDFAAETLEIGRAPECAVQLADLAVEPRHARVTAQGEGVVLVEASGSLGFTVDGQAVQRATIVAEKGAELRFGGHRITLTREADGAVSLTVRRVEAISESAAALDARRNFSLASALPGKRAMAWALFAIILALFALVPIASNLLRAPQPQAAVAMDKSWSSGPLSAAHHALEKDCTACHVKPFESVRDAACLSCHKDSHDHARPALLAAARPAPGLGGALLQTVAKGFGKPGPGACVDCHTEHEGQGRMQPVRQAFCADCHGDLDARLKETALGDASDFGTAHPEFRAKVARAPAEHPQFTSVSLADKPVDANGLTFPHDVHLAKRGTVARMAQTLGKGAGYGGPLDCANCHRASADGVRFQPIDMERDCESCHSLAYDMVGSTVRRLRHGDFAQMVADLRTAQRLGGGSGGGLSARQRPASPYRASFPPPFGNTALARAVARDGICGECHVVQRKGDISAWQVTPVHQTMRFFENGWFDHRPHREEACASCHKAETSTKASDLLLPAISQCRTCHMGENDRKADVPSGCVMCHSYHPQDGAPLFSTPATRLRAPLRAFVDPRLEKGAP